MIRRLALITVSEDDLCASLAAVVTESALVTARQACEECKC